MKKIQWLFGRIDYAYRLFYRKLRRKRLVRRKVANKTIMDDIQTEEYIIRKIQSGEPFMVGRMGSIELSAMEHTYEKKIGFSKQIPQRTIDMLCFNAGFFPNAEKAVQRFGELMQQSMKDADLLGSFHDNELFSFKYHTDPNVTFCQLKDIEPVLGKADSWLKSLKGKKVLVIHPYEKSIRMQYEKRNKIFLNGFLPDFELKTIKAVQTIGGTSDERFKDWFEALDWMERQMDSMDYDIALIGCGAYGFPLAAHAKRSGKQAIHIGGATQLIFGIIGSRWENKAYVKKCLNEYWVRPLAEETPITSNEVENACYW